jgi:AraC-like DNA-binding protein
MRYRKFQPATELLPFVECFFVWEGEAVEPMDVQSPPNGFCSMVFNYSNPYEAYQDNTSRVTVPLAFASGQFTSNYHLVLSGKIGMAGIVFKPTALHNMFGLRMSQLVNSRVPLSLLLASPTDQLLEWVKNAGSDEGRIDLLNDFLQPLVRPGKANLSVIDEAVDYIDLNKGGISVEAVATHFRISRRYLEKRFLQKVGVSPKFYSRIKRFSDLSNKLAHSENVDWLAIVLENGLHDQSHLVKEFLEFNRMNPTDYYNKHNELIRYVKPR